ncbi:MAG: zinc ribbon domain-containing protein [Saprospiraceae bacterium]|nr:zinc ribbon domain-containing protein [Pyrinomonadaceae bacterium]
MHCPRCGQQQISEQTKFCSRCGFQLGLVSELLVHGGVLPQLAELSRNRSIFTRRNGVAFSLLWCLFFLLIMTPLWGILDVDELAGASAIIGIFGGLMFLVSSMFFLKKASPSFDLPPSITQNQQPANLYGAPSMNALPPQQSQPVSTYMAPEGSWRAADTGDLARPGSVTEGTTKLLKKDQEL